MEYITIPIYYGEDEETGKKIFDEDSIREEFEIKLKKAEEELNIEE